MDRADDEREALDRIHRAAWGRLLSLLIARTRRLDLAEDALGEAFEQAADRWPSTGVPANPEGWLYRTAHRRIIGALRSEAIHGRVAPLVAVSPAWEPTDGDDLDELEDERLALVLLCSHPALRPEARSALALRLVIGTPTEELARLFLVSRSTMAARVTRAKKKIVAAGIPLARPVDDELHARLDDVCRTIYLAFTAGYTPGTGPDLLRSDLAGDAVALASVLDRVAPGAHQVRALLGLLLLQHARRDARVAAGRLVTLPEQDRSLWRHDELAKGRALLESIGPGEGYGESLRLQGLIAAEHAIAASAGDTNWPAIAELYGRLEQATGSPVVTLNRAVAVAEASGAAAGLRCLDGLEARLPGNHRLHAVVGDLARRNGDPARAREAFERAIELCGNETEQRFLTERLAALGPP